VIGTDAQGAIWLITVDGRNPAISFGMSFTELQGLSKRLGLRSVLNLDRRFDDHVGRRQDHQSPVGPGRTASGQ